MTSDPALIGVGRKDGLSIWRINKGKLEVVPELQWGAFYDGDSYVVLSTKRNASVWDVHFWLGKNSTADEMGTAATKTVEIDQALGGFPTQYREVQQYESPLFLSYFKNGIRYMTGGYDDGYHNLEDMLKDFKPVLYRCKGKRNVRCVQMQCTKESLNLGDVFILDAGRDIFVWMPPDCGRLERIRGMARAKNIADKERPGLCQVHVLDDSWKSDINFWKHFGGKEVIPSIAQGQNDDENFWERNKDQVTLWKVSDVSGEATVKWLAQGDDVKQSLLDTNDAFILDAVNGVIYVWVGKGCTLNERGKAFHWGQTYLLQQNLPPWTTTRVVETTEPFLFTQWFTGWQGAKHTNEFQPRLFQCSNESGRLVVEEIVDFDQECLDGDDVMILPFTPFSCGWAREYLKNGAVKRHKDATIETVFQGSETPTFKKFFPAWDDGLFKNEARSVENMRKLMFN